MQKELEVAGKRINYRVSGKGKPVMLVHGFGETGTVWEKQVAFLQDHFLLIVPDLPGSGSAMIDDMSMEGMAEVLNEVLEKEAIGKAALIGHSMGGYIALAFAKKYSRYLNGLGLFHSTAFADSDEKKATRKKGIEFIQKNGTLEFLKTTTPNLFSPLSQEQKPEMIDEFIRTSYNFSIPAFVSYYESMMARPDSTELLKTTSLPVLFVLGEYDNAVPLQDGLKLVHLPEKSYIHILHQSGHMGMLEEEDKSNVILKKYLSEI